MEPWSLRKLIFEVGVRAFLGGQLIPGQDAFENCSTDSCPQFFIWTSKFLMQRFGSAATAEAQRT